MNGEEKKQAKPAQEQAAQGKPAQEQQASAAPQAQDAGKAPQKDAGKEEKKRFGKKKSEADDLREQLKSAVGEAEKQKERLLRTAAEYDNFRKRTEREKGALYASATADTVAAFLEVADNLERALAQQDCSLEDLRKGVEMVHKQMCAALDKLGVKAMGAKGDPFDADLHNAVSHIEDEALGENVIAAVYQKGYCLGDRVVRHAMVQVAN